MTTVSCGYRDCSYNVNGLCGKAFIGIGTKRYGNVFNACSGYTRDKVDDIVLEAYTKELKSEVS